MSRAGIRVLAACVVTLGACGGGGGGTVTARNPSTTAAPVTTPGGPSVTVGIICSTPTDAAQSVVSAWMVDDAAGAARCATSVSVSTLFTRKGSGAHWTFHGCGGPDPAGPICTFDYPGGHATFTVQGSDAQGWKVAQVAFAP